jgi:hypothetical protein
MPDDGATVHDAGGSRPTGTDGGARGESFDCTPGVVEACHPDPSIAGIGACTAGMRTCEPAGEFGRWSACEGAIGPSDEGCGDETDEDCDGAIDEGCPTIVTIGVDLDGDCLTARCPEEAPYPIGCSIHMDGGDSRGCVASSPTSSVVYFQEGDRCGAGHVSGTLTCSSEPGEGLDETNCMINKPTRYYPTDRSGCPDT